MNTRNQDIHETPAMNRPVGRYGVAALPISGFWIQIALAPRLQAHPARPLALYSGLNAPRLTRRGRDRVGRGPQPYSTRTCCRLSLGLTSREAVTSCWNKSKEAAMEKKKVRFYFAQNSPYSFLANRRLDKEIAALAAPVGSEGPRRNPGAHRRQRTRTTDGAKLRAVR